MTEKILMSLVHILVRYVSSQRERSGPSKNPGFWHQCRAPLSSNQTIFNFLQMSFCLSDVFISYTVRKLVCINVILILGAQCLIRDSVSRCVQVSFACIAHVKRTYLIVNMYMYISLVSRLYYTAYFAFPVVKLYNTLSLSCGYI